MGAWGWFKNRFFGGDASKGLDAKFQHGDLIGRTGENQLGLIAQRQAPQIAGPGAAAQLAGGPQDEVRAQQMALGNQLGQIAGGTRVGAGEMAVNRQANQAGAAQMAAARAVRGSNAALAARGAARNIADLGTNAAGMAQQAALGDQANAQNQLGSLLAGTRGQDIGYAGQNATLQQQNQQLGQQALMANQGAELQSRGINDAANQAYMAQLQGLDEAQLKAELAKRGFQMGDKGQIGALLQAGGQFLSSYIGKK